MGASLLPGAGADDRGIGTAATSRSAGCVIHSSGAAAKTRLTAQTVTDIGALQRCLRTDLGFRKTGCIRLASNKDDLEQLRAQADVTCAVLRDPSAAVVIDGAAAEARVPWLQCPESAVVPGALFTAVDGVMDPTVLAGAYLQAARAADGAVVETISTAVQSFVTDGSDRVIGVRTPGGDGPGAAASTCCDYAVAAAGAWTGLLTEPLGSTLPGLPMAPTRSHYWLSKEAPATFDGGDPIVIMPGARAYTRPEGPHGCLLGLQEPASLSWDPRSLPGASVHSTVAHSLVSASALQAEEMLLSQFGALIDFFPQAAEIGWGNYTAGLSTYTIDGKLPPRTIFPPRRHFVRTDYN